LEYTDVSAVQNASKIRVMEAAQSTLRLHGATSQKALIFILILFNKYNLTAFGKVHAKISMVTSGKDGV
jgi:hypothetical protein